MFSKVHIVLNSSQTLSERPHSGYSKISSGSTDMPRSINTMAWCGGVVCGVWSVVRGVWSVECGVWSVECGVWCGVWSVVCGVWCVVCGVWCVVCGVWWCGGVVVCCVLCAFAGRGCYFFSFFGRFLVRIHNLMLDMLQCAKGRLL